MDYQVILSPRAVQDLREIVRYISYDDPIAAERFGEQMLDAALSLSMLPERGRLVPEFDDDITREVIFRGRYRIVYRVDHKGKTVGVSRFWHGSRLLSAGEN